jgi:hypothetical protein
VQFFQSPRNLNSGIIILWIILAIFFVLFSTQRNFSDCLIILGRILAHAGVHVCTGHLLILSTLHSALSIVSWMIFAVRCRATRVPHFARHEYFVCFCVVTVLPRLSHRSMGVDGLLWALHVYTGSDRTSEVQTVSPSQGTEVDRLSDSARKRDLDFGYSVLVFRACTVFSACTLRSDRFPGRLLL